MKVVAWMLVACLGVGLLAVLVVPKSRTLALNDERREVLTELEVPSGWTETSASTRDGGLLGWCWLSAGDVRPCPSTTLSYALDAIPDSPDDLSALLPSAQWAVDTQECDAIPESATGTFRTCSATATQGDMMVTVGVDVQAVDVGVTGDTNGDRRGATRGSAMIQPVSSRDFGHIRAVDSYGRCITWRWCDGWVCAVGAG